MRDKAIDVMFIQETKWTEEYCWSNREYNYVHSAGLQKVDKVGGVLTVVSAKVAKSSDVQFQSIWARKTTSCQNTHRRVCNRLAKCISILSHRQTGDFTSKAAVPSTPTEMCGRTSQTPHTHSLRRHEYLLRAYTTRLRFASDAHWRIP